MSQSGLKATWKLKVDISIVRESARDTYSPGYRYRKGFSGKDNDSQDVQGIKISVREKFLLN